MLSKRLLQKRFLLSLLLHFVFYGMGNHILFLQEVYREAFEVQIFVTICLMYISAAQACMINMWTGPAVAWMKSRQTISI